MTKRIVFGCLLSLAPLSATAATVNLTVNWTVSGNQAVPATSYRIEEQVGGIWSSVGTVAAPTTTFQILGRPVGVMSTFHVVPVANGLDGTISNATTCGALAPSETLNVTCAAVVVP